MTGLNPHNCNVEKIEKAQEDLDSSIDSDFYKEVVEQKPIVNGDPQTVLQRIANIHDIGIQKAKREKELIKFRKSNALKAKKQAAAKNKFDELD